MGNLTSCFCVKLQKAKLIDVHGNLRDIKVPITAAEIMLLEQPGHLISPVAKDLRRSFRLSALRADEVLTHGKLYLLIPAGRLNSFITESELEMLRSGCNRKIGGQAKRRRNSKVLPQEERSCTTNEVGDDLGASQNDNTGFGYGIAGSPLWKPVLEPIYE